MSALERSIRYREKNRDVLRAKTLAHYHANKDEINAKKRAWRIANPRESYDSKLRDKYKLSRASYDLLVLVQEGRCHICSTPMGSDPATRPCLDHSHASGGVRHVLCHRCNVALGLFLEDPERMQRAIDYLRSF